MVPASRHGREKIWFDRWVTEGYSIRQLSQQSGHTQTRLRRIISYWLGRLPEKDAGSLKELEYVVFDATYLYRPIGVVALMDGVKNSIVAGTYGVNENSLPQLKAFLEPLKQRGLAPVSATTDGNPQAIKAISNLWPDAIMQRCLVHIQRQGLSWCRRSPRRADAKELREIFLMVTAITTKKERDKFLEKVAVWEHKYGKHIATKPERGRVFSDVRRARSMLLKALPNMFYYLENPAIPSTTNALEGYFSRLKNHYRSHRGLAPKNRKCYFEWYFKLRPR